MLSQSSLKIGETSKMAINFQSSLRLRIQIQLLALRATEPGDLHKSCFALGGVPTALPGSETGDLSQIHILTHASSCRVGTLLPPEPPAALQHPAQRREGEGGPEPLFFPFGCCRPWRGTNARLGCGGAGGKGKALGEPQLPSGLSPRALAALRA